MTLNTGIFDVSDPQNPDRVYSAALLCRMMAKQIRDGIVHGDGDEMAVTVTDPPAMTVLVGTGTAMVQGRFCENDAALTLAVPAAHATYPRIDRVVVRLNASPGRTIDIVVKPGTAAPTPAAPALTRTAETWELSLAQVRVEAGATLILSAKITDERGNTSLCGVACPVYVPSTQLEVVGAVNMQGKALTGLPVPSAATDAARRDMGGATLQNLGAPVNANDAARKAYVDDKVAGFGISQIAIDANKNWNGKNITNVGALDTLTGNVGARSLFVDVPGDTVRKTVYPGVTVAKGVGEVTVATITVPASYSPVANSSEGRFIVKITGQSESTAWSATAKVYRGAVQIGSASMNYTNGGQCTINTSGGFAAGDVLTIKVIYDTDSQYDPTSVTCSEVQVKSTRSTTTAANKVFLESGSW